MSPEICTEFERLSNLCLKADSENDKIFDQFDNHFESCKLCRDLQTAARDTLLSQYELSASVPLAVPPINDAKIEKLALESVSPIQRLQYKLFSRRAGVTILGYGSALGLGILLTVLFLNKDHKPQIAYVDPHKAELAQAQQAVVEKQGQIAALQVQVQQLTDQSKKVDPAIKIKLAKLDAENKTLKSNLTALQSENKLLASNLDTAKQQLAANKNPPVKIPVVTKPQQLASAALEEGQLSAYGLRGGGVVRSGPNTTFAAKLSALRKDGSVTIKIKSADQAAFVIYPVLGKKVGDRLSPGKMSKVSWKQSEPNGITLTKEMVGSADSLMIITAPSEFDNGAIDDLFKDTLSARKLLRLMGDKTTAAQVRVFVVKF